ncbi:MAG: hypothetical protein LBT35_04215, partial [Tannerella sp.]|nr:hypothetical protein [Tannerella sp.]
MKHVLLTVVACALFTGCSNSSKKAASDSFGTTSVSTPTSVPTLDLGQTSYLKTDETYEETVRYILLETRDDVLIAERR